MSRTLTSNYHTLQRDTDSPTSGCRAPCCLLLISHPTLSSICHELCHLRITNSTETQTFPRVGAVVPTLFVLLYVTHPIIDMSRNSSFKYKTRTLSFEYHAQLLERHKPAHEQVPILFVICMLFVIYMSHTLSSICHELHH